jgi:hypothetical protein
MKPCVRCGRPYKPEKSRSALRYTYCGIFCEIADIGCSMEDLDKLIVVTVKSNLRELEALLS